MFKHEELLKKLEEEIKNGVYRPGERIASENQMPSRYNVSKNTARKALANLLEKGLIYRIQGKGTFVTVTKPPIDSTVKGIKEQSAEIEDISESLNRCKTISQATINNELLAFVQEKSGQNIFKCYQCGKCSAGCPVAGHMDYLPSQIIRMLQIGDSEAILSSKAIWYCASCFMCDSRCPKGIDFSKITEAIRNYQLRKGVDYTDVYKIDDRLLDEIPQQAVVSNFRKFTG